MYRQKLLALSRHRLCLQPRLPPPVSAVPPKTAQREASPPFISMGSQARSEGHHPTRWRKQSPVLPGAKEAQSQPAAHSLLQTPSLREHSSPEHPARASCKGECFPCTGRRGHAPLPCRDSARAHHRHPDGSPEDLTWHLLPLL